METTLPAAVPPTALAAPTPPPVAAAPAPAKRVLVADHPLAQHALMALRDKHTPPARYRQISNQLLVLLTIEATRSLPTRDDLVETALGGEITSPPWPRLAAGEGETPKPRSVTHTGRVLAKPVVLLSVTRHGLGLAHQVAEFMPGLLVGAISLDRPGGNPTAEPRLHLINAPALGDARVILFDPVVATGATAAAAVNFLRRSGATDITLVSFLVSFQGLTRLQSALPSLTIWTAGIDSDWDSKRGAMPGLGNVAERLYG